MNLRLRSLLAFLFSLTSATLLLAQTDSSLYYSVESFLELSEDESEASGDILEQIEYLHQHPLNLNRASETEILTIPIIPPQLLLAIINYRKDKQQFKDWQELYQLLGYNLSLLNLLQYLSYLGDGPLKGINLNPKAEEKLKLSLYGGRRFPNSAGYSPANPDYLGSPWRYASRVQYQKGQKLFTGLAFEKDAGEVAFKNKHPQFISGFLEIRNISKLIPKVIIGDYQFISGQGLSNGNSFALGRSLNLESSYQGANNIKAHTSTNEWHYHRGLAVEMVKGKFRYQGGFSFKPSQLNEEDLSPNIIGYYRSEQEINRYQRGLVKSLMHYAAYQNNKVKLGAGISTHEKSLNLTQHKSQSLSFDASFYLNRGIIFTELSHGSNEGNTGSNLILGATMALSNQLQISTVLRQLHSVSLGPYHAIKFQKAADEERGGFVQLRYLISKKSTLSFLYDRYTSLNLDDPYFIRVPSHDITIQYALKKRRDYLFYLRARFRDQQSFGLTPEYINEKLVRAQSIQLRAHIDKSIHEHFHFSARLEMKNHNGSNDFGLLLYQQINWTINERFAIISRASWFRIDNYDLRIYAYEPQVPSIYSLPSHYGRGQKTIIKIKMQLGRGLSMWLRLAQSYYYDRIALSSGANQIAGNKVSDLHFCLRKSF